jgi:hypothetical protein
LDVALAMLSAVDKSADMIVFGTQLPDDQEGADGAPLVEFLKDPKFDARRDLPRFRVWRSIQERICSSLCSRRRDLAELSVEFIMR